ncbi:MAG: thioredoxin family protein [Spirochaetales bacterium]|nr:thioredoxin family protein [Spirochaetales bacterium]
MKTSKIIYIALILLLAGGAFFLFANGNEDEVNRSETTGESSAPLEAAIVFDENAYPPNGWTVSMAEAAAEAEASGKMILLNFTGSDWCGWCQKLEQQVFSQPEFLSWANDNLVMVFIDSPSSIVLDDPLVEQNQLLQQALGIQGFPTVFLLGSDLTPLLRTGYMDGLPADYIHHLETDRLGLDEESEANFRNGFSGFIEEQLKPLNI